MKLIEIFEDSIRFSFSDKKVFFNVGALSLFPLLVFGVLCMLLAFMLAFPKGFIGSDFPVPSFDLESVKSIILFIVAPLLFSAYLLGYQVEIIKKSIEGVETAPEIKGKMTHMILDGLKVLFIGTIYMFIPLIFFIGSLWPLINMLLQQVYYNEPVINITFLIIGIILTPLFYSLLLIAKSNMASSGKLKSAFQLKDIKKSVQAFGTKKYVSFALILFLAEAALVIFSILALITFIGFFLVGLAILPFLIMFESRAMALVYKKSIENEL